jgi:excisionase family DNA binding protein
MTGRYEGDSRRGLNVDGNNERLLTPGEVAALFRVDPKTVTRWAASGRITSIRTPGGHRRFRESEVRALLRGDSESSPQSHAAALGG